ncbi:MAG: 3'-5' exonuclease [Bacteroidia bacterium]|nr:3'-5' exonuclease [Bacteroidia bacterium]
MNASIPQLPFPLERPLAFFDLETTGVSIQTDRIVEIAVVKLLPKGGMKELTYRVNPEMPIPKEATAVHGISDADVALEPTFAQLATRLQDFLRDCDLSGFNVRRFDLPMLQEEFKRCGMEWDMDGRHVVDSLTIFHLKEPRDLTAAYRFYCAKEHTGAHGALADVLATAEVFAAQLLRYEDLPRNIAELETVIHPRDPSWIDDEGKFIWQNGASVISFGKHKGKTLQQLVSAHRDYLEWIISGNFPETAKKVIREALSGRYPTAPAG